MLPPPPTSTLFPYTTLFRSILSLRTQDTTTGPAAQRLFALADTPKDLLTLSPRVIERAIYPVGFYRTKDRKSTRLNSSHTVISYAVFCLKKKKKSKTKTT